jgi:hypothetical protein
MAWMTAAAIGGSALLGSYASSQAGNKQADAAERAAQIQADASRYAADLQQQQYNENVARQQPFYQAGVNALPELVSASRYTPFSMEQFQADPGYAFRLSEGTKALDRSAAARGGLISGGALKAATRFGQDMGSQEYTNAFNRYQTERAARLNPLQSLTGMGQTTAAGLGAAGQNMASSVGNYGMQGAAATGEGYLGAANARASGYMGTANAINSGLTNYLGYQQNQQQNNLLTSYLAKQSGAGGFGSTSSGYIGAPTTAPSYYG